MTSLYQLILVHLRTFVREPAIIFWAVLFPILMAWILGVAFSNPGETTQRVYVTGDAPLPAKVSGTRVIGNTDGTPMRVIFEPHSETEAIRAIKRGTITIYLEVAGDSIFYHFDPANAEGRLIHLMLEKDFHSPSASASGVRALSAKGTRYIDFLIPGLIALGIMNSCLWGIGWSLIETRMKKLLRRMVATPMKKPIFLSSHMITRVFMGGLETLLLVGFAHFYFGTGITGSITAFILVFLAGIFAFAGIGILTASRTDRSEVGNGLINAVTLTMMILSGIFFNYHNFPDWAVSIIRFLPLTMLADALRAVSSEAAGISDVGIPLVVLCSIGLVTFVTGLRIFKWY